jgi:fructokinase
LTADLNAKYPGTESPERRMVCWGELVWDFFGDFCNDFRDEGPRLGGSAANVAYHLRRLGAGVDLVSLVGADELGNRAVADLTRNGVGTRLVQRDAGGATGAVRITPSPDGPDFEPRFERMSRARFSELRVESRASDTFRRADAVCFAAVAQGTLLAAGPLAEALELASPRCLRFCDLNLRPPTADPGAVRALADLSDVVKVNVHELAVLERSVGASDGVAWLLARRPRLVAVTRGRDGARLVTRRSVLEDPGYRADPGGDPIGAGDAFVAALAHSVLEKRALPVALGAANRYASFVASSRGAQPPVPAALIAAVTGRGPEAPPPGEPDISRKDR